MGNSSGKRGSLAPADPKWDFKERAARLALYKERDGIFFSGKYILLWDAKQKSSGGDVLWFRIEKNLDQTVAERALRRLSPFSDIAGMTGPEYVKLFSTLRKEPTDMPSVHLLALAELSGQLEDALRRRLLDPSVVAPRSRDSLLHTIVTKPSPGALRCLSVVLAAHGCPNINSRNKKGQMPLHICAAHGNAQMIQKLVASGAEVNGPDGNGRTALHEACRLDRRKIVESLFEWGADCAVESELGTPLHICSFYGSVDCLRFLLDSGGVAIDTVNKKGNTALHMAAFPLDVSDFVVVNAAEEEEKKGGPKEDVKSSASKAQEARARAAHLLLERGAAVDARTREDEMTALHLAARNSLPIVVSMLCRKGAAVGMADAQLNTPLHLAVKKCNVACVRTLCSSVDAMLFDLHAKNREGKSILEVAEEENNDSCLRYVLGVQVQQLITENQQFRDSFDAAITGDRVLAAAVPASTTASASAPPEESEQKQAGPSPSPLPPPRPSLARQSSGKDLIQHLESQRAQLVTQVDYLKLRLNEVQTQLSKTEMRCEALEQKQDSLMCSVCLEDDVNVAFVPCGHVCTCVRCSAKLSECPLCREHIQSKLRIYGNK